MALEKNVLLFSTGLDSYIMKKVFSFKNEECLFVDMGTKENEIEKERIQQYFPEVIITKVPLNSFELQNKIIPYRNHHLALIAANYANNIYFAFTAGDTTKDKDYVFKAQMEGILNYFSLSTEKVAVQGPFLIEIPFKQFTKTELVKMYLKEGFPLKDILEQSSSCYEGHSIPCGKCRSCLRKFVAFYLNGIDISEFYLENPADYLKNFLQESINKGRETEIKEIEKCINLIRL